MYNIDRLAKNVYQAENANNPNQYALILKNDDGTAEVTIHSTKTVTPIYESTDKWDIQVNRLIKMGYNVTEEPPRYWGGSREGAGRPSTGRKKHQYYVSDEEDTQIKNLINQLRNPSK